MGDSDPVEGSRSGSRGDIVRLDNEDTAAVVDKSWVSSLFN